MRVEDFFLISPGLMDQVNREEASGGKQLLQRITMSGNNTNRPQPKGPHFREPHCSPPLALPSPSGTRRTHLPGTNTPPALAPKPGVPRAPLGQGASQRAFATVEDRREGQSMHSGLDSHLHGLGAPQGAGAARSGEGTGRKLVLPALPPSSIEGLESKNCKLRPGLPGPFEGLSAKIRAYNISFNSTCTSQVERVTGVTDLTFYGITRIQWVKPGWGLCLEAQSLCVRNL